VTSGGTTRRFAYDGHTLLSEHDGATQALLRRFVHGPGVDGGRRPRLAYPDGAVFSEWRDIFNRVTLVGAPAPASTERAPACPATQRAGSEKARGRHEIRTKMDLIAGGRASRHVRRHQQIRY